MRLIRVLSASLFYCISLAAADDPFALAARAQEVAKAGDHAAAERLYRQVAGLVPGQISPWIAVADSALKAKDPDAALDALEHAVRLGAVIDFSGDPWSALGQSDRLHAMQRGVESNRKLLSRSRVVAAFEPRTLVPESLGVDPKDGSFIVGSMYERRIVRVDPSGKVSDLVPAGSHGLLSVLGIKIDPVKREVWANACNTNGQPPMTPADPESEGRAALFRFSLDDGSLIRRYDPPADLKPICFNDLVLTSRGVFMTSGTSGLWRVDPKNEALELFDPLPGAFLNGIAAPKEGGELFLADAFKGLLHYEVASRSVSVMEDPADVALGSIDGLYLHDGSLIGIQNALRPVPPRVLRARLSSDQKTVISVDILERNHPLYDIPTCGVIAGDELIYIANSQLRSFTDGVIWPSDRLEPTYLLALPLK